MKKKYKRIYCCGECVYYNLKKHECRIGAKEEGTARDRFYLDCPLKTFEEDKEQGGESMSKDKETRKRSLKSAIIIGEHMMTQEIIKFFMNFDYDAAAERIAAELLEEDTKAERNGDK